MIEKERLEELIEQGATIYVHNERYIGYCLLTSNMYCDDEMLYIQGDDEGEIEYLEHLFETKEEAEEYAEFGNITRTERLELPSWELFKDRYKGIGFKVEDYIYKCFADGIEIEILQFWGRGCKSIFKAPLTRENYNEARRLCIKLFKGED